MAGGLLFCAVRQSGSVLSRAHGFAFCNNTVQHHPWMHVPGPGKRDQFCHGLQCSAVVRYNTLLIVTRVDLDSIVQYSNRVWYSKYSITRTVQSLVQLHYYS